MKPHIVGRVDLSKHRALPWWVARKFRAPSIARDLDDLRQEAAVAMIIAAPLHDPAKSRFATYATGCMRNRLSRYISDNVRLGRYGNLNQSRAIVTTFSLAINRHRIARSDARQVLQSLYGWRRDQDQNVTDLDVDSAWDFALMAEARLDVEVASHRRRADFTMSSRVESLVDEAHADDTETSLLLSDWRRVFDALDLEPRVREIVERCSLQDPPESLTVLAKEHGLSRERIRQLEAKGLRIYRAALQSAGLVESRGTSTNPSENP